MSARELLDEAAARGVKIHIEDGRLVCEGPRAQVADLLPDFRENKADLMAALTQPVSDPSEIWADAYTPKGELIRVRCDSEAHQKWVEGMNPPRTRGESPR